MLFFHSQWINIFLIPKAQRRRVEHSEWVFLFCFVFLFNQSDSSQREWFACKPQCASTRGLFDESAAVAASVTVHHPGTCAEHSSPTTFSMTWTGPALLALLPQIQKLGLTLKAFSVSEKALWQIKAWVICWTRNIQHSFRVVVWFCFIFLDFIILK